MSKLSDFKKPSNVSVIDAPQAVMERYYPNIDASAYFSATTKLNRGDVDIICKGTLGSPDAEVVGIYHYNEDALYDADFNLIREADFDEGMTTMILDIIANAENLPLLASQ